MATGRRHRRSKDKKPKSKRVSKKDVPPTPTAGPTSVNDVPDHVLELILLHLESSACLLRAAAACKRWRRIAVAAGFLPRYRSLHSQAPFVAGHYHAFDPDWVDYESPPITDNPVFVPSPSLTVDCRHFSLDDFLPDSDSGWALADSRGGLLLLFRRRTGWDAHARSRSFPDLLVCEPLTRRCQGILRPPEHATCLGVFLLDDGFGGRVVGMSMSSFRVVSVLHEDHASEEGRGMPVACVFTSGSDGGWRVLLPAGASTNSAAVSLPGAIDCISFAGRVNGSLYWVAGEDSAIAMLVLDEATMEFSRVPFLTDDDNTGGPYDRWSFRVIGGGKDDHAPRVVRLVSNELIVLVQHHKQGGDKWWVVEKLVRLPEATLKLEGRKQRFFQRNAMIVAANETYVLVTPREKTWLFSVEIETLHVEREHRRNKYAGTAYPFQLPSLPSLMACAQHGRRRQSCH
jgi:hypothetical protein